MTGRARVPVVCAVIYQGEKVLAARRPEEKTNGGLWEFPGGKVHDGESPEAALTREIREELGVGVVVHEALTAVSWEYPWIAIELLPFVCSLHETSVPRLLDHTELRFVSRSEAAELAWAPADQVIVGQLFND